MKIDEIMAKVDEVDERINLIKGKKKYITLNDIINKYPYTTSMIWIVTERKPQNKL